MGGDRVRAELVTRTAACTALIAVGGWISVPFIPVPFTLQTMFVLLTAPVMKKGAPVPVLLYLLLGLAGLPVFHSGTAGIGVLLGPTGGFLAGFVPAALLAGLGYAHGAAWSKTAGIACAEIAIFACGTGWLMASAGLGMSAAILIGVVPFIPGDVVKSAAAYLIGERIIRADEQAGGQVP